MRILWALFRIPKLRISDSTSKNFPVSGIRVPLHGEIFRLISITIFYYNPCPYLPLPPWAQRVSSEGGARVRKIFKHNPCLYLPLPPWAQRVSSEGVARVRKYDSPLIVQFLIGGEGFLSEVYISPLFAGAFAGVSYRQRYPSTLFMLVSQRGVNINGKYRVACPENVKISAGRFWKFAPHLFVFQAEVPLVYSAFRMSGYTPSQVSAVAFKSSWSTTFIKIQTAGTKTKLNKT